MNELSVSNAEKELFLEQVWSHYAKHGRHDLPWRRPEADGAFAPYKILVSELMLQQTQVSRVIPKYEAFLQRYPTVEVLARATLGDVLKQWQGLGYNRRAKFLWQAAQALQAIGNFPSNLNELVRLPGVGVNTAGAILAYAFDMPVLFVETNIRTVYIHHFFSGQDAVTDSAITAVLEQTIATEHAREFFWALMDYGAWLKTQVRTNSRSKQYVRQSRFEGSKRQIRGQIIRELTTQTMNRAELFVCMPDERLDNVLVELINEGLIVKKRTKYSLQ